jgi:hypothetical protein
MELDFENGWLVLQGILEQAEKSLTPRTILRCWPATAMAPSKVTLWKWLGRAVQEGRVLQNGAANSKRTQD